VGTANAQFVAQSVPSAMTAAQVYPVRVTFKNTGSVDWSPTDGYRLVSQNPQGNVTWGLSQVPLASVVSPGQSVVINFNVTAPTAPGSYNFQWQLAAGGTVLGTPSTNVTVSVAPKGNVLFLMAFTGANMRAGDTAAMNHLTSLGYAVTPFYACTAQDPNGAVQAAAGKNLVIIGGSTPVPTCGDAVGAAWQSVGVPIIVSKAAMLPKMLMTSAGANSGWGSAANQSQVSIVDPASPLAAGLSGTITVETAAQPWFAWGHANANATVGASVVGAGGQHTLFGYPKDVLMPGGYAPACRVGAFWGDDDPASFTANGWRLFDAAVAWATRAGCR
jgi:hypothetical protein